MELLERDQALEELRCLLRQADAGRGCLLFLGGEAGVGKTSLLRRFIAEAQDSVRALVGHCDALSTPRPLGPLFDIGDSALTRLLDEHAPRDLLFRTLLSRLTSRTRGTLLAIEDAHWADEATLDLLRYLGRRVTGTRALTIVTYRNDEVGPRHPLRRLLGDLATVDSVQRLDLPPLSAESVKALATGSGLDAAALHERTHGNPFFVTEVLAAGGEIPPSVRDAVLARASRLAPSAWAVLEAAAVIGSPLEVTLLDAVVHRGPGDLEACLESGMLRAEGHALEFRHELAREAILTAIGPPHRAALHRDILRALEAAPAPFRNAARLAHHAEEAGDAPAVLRHASEAGRRAMLLRAHREAADQFARALRFAGGLAAEERAQLLEARAYACYMTAQIDDAIADRTAALDIWTALGNQRKEGETRGHLATLYWAQAKITDAEREAESAVALLEQLPAGPELAMAYGTLARLSGTNLYGEAAICFGEKAIALAERIGATETLIDALLTVGEAKLSRGSIPSGQEQIETAMRYSADAGLDDVTARAYLSLGYGFAELGRFATAATHYEQGIRFCRERDLDLPLHHLTALLARCRLLLGEWDDALDLATSVLQARDAAPSSRFEAELVAGRVMARRGIAGADDLLANAVKLATDSGCIVYLGPIQSARAEAAFLSGKLDEALSAARAAFDLAVERGYAWCAGELAYWRWKSGDPNIAVDSTDSPFDQQIAGDWAGAAAAWDALGCPYEAARARAEGDDEEAMRSALATFEMLGALPAASAVRRRLRARGALGIPRGPRPSTRTHPAGLTAREFDVAVLLADGQGNPEIASRLFLSPRTVENHIASIRSKLGARSRAEASEVARRLGILPQFE
jgi:DNA-binding CsgD family transcriptional regulator/tetratricopeptide (TPR) repeat protein